MPKAIDLTGKRFGKLTVIEKHPESTKYHNQRWVCRCDCGKGTISSGGNLKAGHVTSCGCQRRPHGWFGTRLYDTWHGMKARCLNKRCAGYKDYGGRGIKICAEWMEFAPFKDWAIANGYSDNLQIDRENVNGNYEPSNCRFVTGTINNQNKRSNVLTPEKVLEIRKLIREGNLQKDIGKRFGVPQNTISQIKNNKLWWTVR
jgi:hypothetical protein